MKKYLMFILILAISLGLVFSACGGDTDGDTDGDIKDNKNTEVLEMKITISEQEFKVKLYDNETAQSFMDMLPMTIEMNELNSNEKYYYLVDNLPTAAINPENIQKGDIMLYGANCLVLFYKTFSTTYSYTKIGKIENTTGLIEALGNGSVAVKFELIESAML